jgi:hypothetical protein
MLFRIHNVSFFNCASSPVRDGFNEIQTLLASGLFTVASALWAGGRRGVTTGYRPAGKLSVGTAKTVAVESGGKVEL